MISNTPKATSEKSSEISLNSKGTFTSAYCETEKRIQHLNMSIAMARQVELEKNLQLLSLGDSERKVSLLQEEYNAILGEQDKIKEQLDILLQAQKQILLITTQFNTHKDDFVQSLSSILECISQIKSEDSQSDRPHFSEQLLSQIQQLIRLYLVLERDLKTLITICNKAIEEKDTSSNFPQKSIDLLSSIYPKTSCIEPFAKHKDCFQVAIHKTGVNVANSGTESSLKEGMETLEIIHDSSKRLQKSVIRQMVELCIEHDEIQSDTSKLNFSKKQLQQKLHHLNISIQQDKQAITKHQQDIKESIEKFENASKHVIHIKNIVTKINSESKDYKHPQLDAFINTITPFIVQSKKLAQEISTL